LSNLIGITRGFVDYGVIALSLLFFLIIIQFRKVKPNLLERNLFFIFIIVFLGLNGSMIFFSNPISHRYFMILHVLMILLIISRLKQLKFHKTLILLVFTAIITGHLWIYPNGRSNGWDVTLKYISYEKNRAQFWNYLAENNIQTSQIQSAFPLFCSLKQTNLTEGERFLDINENGQTSPHYIAFSPVCNDMKSFKFLEKDKNFRLVKKFGKGKTAISLYSKN